MFSSASDFVDDFFMVKGADSAQKVFVLFEDMRGKIALLVI